LKGAGNLGDFGMAVNLETQETSPFIIAETGPSVFPLGEVSIYLAESLGGKNVSPKNGAGKPLGTMLYIIFPYSQKNSLAVVK
jgi:hypothetical protein